MKKLKDILKGVSYTLVAGDLEGKISSVTFDSRIVQPNSLLIAIKGTQTDGHKYISSAIEKGATHIVLQDIPEKIADNVTYIKVECSTKALAVIASNYYNNPSAKLELIGVTGTNGKTTIVTLLHDVFMKLGYKVGLISTIRIKLGKKAEESTHTTPDSLKLNELLAKMVKEGCTHCFMEVSSHAIVQDRVWGINFNGGIFTNITHDHLDYHKTFDNYLKAKKSFFDELDKKSFALVNGDDNHHNYMVQNTNAKVKTFCLRRPCDFKTKILASDFTGMHLEVDGKELYTNKVGDFNASNMLAVYAAAKLMNENKNELLRILSIPNQVEGRFEMIYNKENILGFIDYSHTPDALKNVLRAIKRMNMKGAKVICVFGCGGDRDKEKRPKMGEIASRFSDVVIVTSDNPRFEEPDQIIRDIVNGIDKSEMKKVLTIPDREQAIKTACSITEHNSIVLVTGKGHEVYQDIEGVKKPFDDRLIFLKYLNEIT